MSVDFDKYYDAGYCCAIQDAIEIAECVITSQEVIIGLLKIRINLLRGELGEEE